jgi:hypothetical protein
MLQLDVTSKFGQISLAGAVKADRLKQILATETDAGMKVYTYSFLLLLLSLAFGCTAATVNYRQMTVDPETLRVAFSERVWGDAPAEPFYFVFHMSDGRLQVTHYAGGPGKNREYDFLFVGQDGTVLYREKLQELITGPFGRIYGKVTFFYAPIYRDQPSSLETALYYNTVGYEAPKIVSSLPPQADRLDGISVARVLRGGPEYLVASANYGADGHLESISVNGSKGGDWVHTNYVKPADGSFGVGTMIGDRPETRIRFGIPYEFPIRSYRLPAGSVFSFTPYEVVLDAVQLHFNRSRWVQQDLAPAGGQAGRRFLEFTYTEEDAALDLVDSKHPFASNGQHR